MNIFMTVMVQHFLYELIRHLLYKHILQISNHVKTIFLEFYILQFFLQFHYSANFLEIVLFVWYLCILWDQAKYSFHHILGFLPLLLLSSLSVMMNFEELIKTAICKFSKKNPAFHSQVMLRNSNKSYFILYF